MTKIRDRYWQIIKDIDKTMGRLALKERVELFYGKGIIFRR
jgi:hypothetical protein